MVLFLGDEETVAVVPEKWIVRQGKATACYWPDTPNAEKKVRSQMAAGPLWKAYPVRVLVEGCGKNVTLSFRAEYFCLLFCIVFSTSYIFVSCLQDVNIYALFC